MRRQCPGSYYSDVLRKGSGGLGSRVLWEQGVSNTLEEIRQQYIPTKLMGLGGLRHQTGLFSPLERSLHGDGQEGLD